MPERPNFHDKLYYTKVRMQTKLQGSLDSARFALTVPREQQESARKSSRIFTYDLVSFLSDTKDEHVSKLQLNPVQEFAFRQFSQYVDAEKMQAMTSSPSYTNGKGIPSIKNSLLAPRENGLYISLSSFYRADTNPAPVQSALFYTRFENKWVAPVIYYAFAQKPESQEAVEEFMKRKDVIVYGRGSRIDVAGDKLSRPAIFKETGSFASSDGHEYTVYGWNDTQTRKPLEVREPERVKKTEIIFNPSTI